MITLLNVIVRDIILIESDSNLSLRDNILKKDNYKSQKDYEIKLIFINS